MLVDANTDDIPSAETNVFDVCVIGAGIAGITLASTLSERSLRVLLLEGGGFDYSEESQSLFEGSVVGGGDQEIKTGRLRYFGGTSGHWAGHCMELDPHDFEPKSYASHTGWPIQKSHLSPYRAGAKAWLEVGEAIGADAPFDKVPQTAFKFIKKPLSRSKGLEIDFEPTRFGIKYRKRVVGDPLITLVLNANAIDLQLTESLDTIKHLNIVSLDGTRHGRVRAKQFVVCLGGLETPRFLLNCDKQVAGGIGNSHDLVGRFFGWHPSTKLGHFVLNWEDIEQTYRGIFDWARSEDPQVAYFVPNTTYMRETETLNFLMHVSILSPIDETRNRSWIEFVKSQLCRTDITAEIAESVYGEIWECENFRYDGEIHLLFEQIPNRDSRIMLSNDKDRFGQRKLLLDRRLTEQDLNTVWVAGMQIGRMFASSNIGRVRLEPWIARKDMGWLKEHGLASRPIWHPMGACRMAESDDEGVVDSSLRVFGTTNLYLCGSAVFPTFGHANPSFTITQLALRLADHLAPAT